MPFEKGQSGNPKGRAKGSKGKVTAAAREMFLEVMEGELPNIKRELEEVRRESSKDYLKLLAAFLPYFLPKQTETEVTLVGPPHPPSWFDEVVETETND